MPARIQTNKMNRQQRRAEQRKQKKAMRRAFMKGRDVGWDVGWKSEELDNAIDALEKQGLGTDNAVYQSIYICTPGEDRPSFELTIREFGESIQAEDLELPIPRIVNIFIYKPFPYESNAAMEKACHTILEKFSPYNFYLMVTGTLPKDIADTNENRTAFASYAVTTMLEEGRAEIIEKWTAHLHRLQAFALTV